VISANGPGAGLPGGQGEVREREREAVVELLVLRAFTDHGGGGGVRAEKKTVSN
jgi:hypothetical protein